MLSFLVIALLAGGAYLAFNNLASAHLVRQIVAERDIFTARAVGRLIENYYRNTKSLRGFPALIREFSRVQSRTHSHMMRGPRQKHMTIRPPTILVTDPEGNTLFHSDPDIRASANIETEADGIPVFLDKKIIAYVYTGTMISPRISPADARYLWSLRRSSMIFILIIVLVSVMFAFLLFLHIIKPVRGLIAASRAVSDGDYTARVAAQSGDELGTLAETFNKMAESIASHEAWRRQMIQDAAHELRTPVTFITGTLEMIKDGVYSADTAKIKELHEEAEYLSSLVHQLKLLSRVESDIDEASRTKVNLTSCLHRAISRFTKRMNEKEISVTTEHDTAPVFVYASERGMSQVFRNSLANALKYTPRKGSIHCSLKTDKASAYIIIEDSGPGIPVHERENVFERFYRLDPARTADTGGSGLGLAISRQIVESHQGAITISDSKLGGACFTIRLPQNR